MQIHVSVWVAILGMGLASIGCGSGEIDADGDDFGFEGDEAGECSDGVDNDQDGLTDCDDDGCEAATSCSGDDDDIGDDDIGDDDAGDDVSDDDVGDDDVGDDDVGDDDTGDDDDTSAIDDLWALDFDGFDDCAVVGDQVAFDQLDQALTIEAWISAMNNDSGFGLPVVSKRLANPEPADSGFTLHYWSWDGPGYSPDSMRFQVGTDEGLHEMYGWPYSIHGSTWTYVVAVYDGSEMRTYVDGALDASQPATGTIVANDDSFDIGCRSDSGSYLFEGQISQVRIWARVLSEAEIQQQFIQPGSIDPSDLIGRWDIDEGTGNILHDASGHGYDAIVYGGATWIPM